MPEIDSDKADRIGLPPKPFMYTIYQIAYLLSLDETHVKRRLIHFDGRSIGAPTKHEMVAYNMARPNERPVWRVPERHLVNYMKAHGLRYYERGHYR